MRNTLPTVALFAALIGAFSASAQPRAGTVWPVPDIAAPKTELALEAFVTISAAVTVASSLAITNNLIGL